MESHTEAYRMAQRSMAELKAAILMVLLPSREEGVSNAEIGRALGIYTGHAGHEGHIPRTLLGIMEAEGVVFQDAETKRWHPKPPRGA